MKKIFIATLSLNSNLEPMAINPKNIELSYSLEKYCNPIVPVMESNLEDGEDAKLIIIRQGASNESDIKNMGLLKEELKAVGLDKVPIEEIILEEAQDKSVLRGLFAELIKHFENDAMYYADFTYGTKPYPIILNTALSYVTKMKTNTEVCGLFYREVLWGKNGESDKTFFYDVSVLLSIANIIDFLGATESENRDQMLQSLLNWKDGEDPCC